MYRIKKTAQATVILAAIAVFSCSKEPVGYLEVRNFTNDTLINVTWGESINLGTIAPGEEEGMETESFDSNYLHFKIGNRIYRSPEEISVDANSSATFIVNDRNQLIDME